MLNTRRDFLTAVAAAVALPGAIRAGRQAGRPSARDASTSLSAGWPGDVPALAQQINGRPLAYLDNAATTLRPRQVIQALTNYYETDNANPSGTLHTLARRSAAALERARQRTARFINAASAEEIIFTRGTTEGINLAAVAWGEANLKAGDEIVISIAEHNSNLFPWQRLAAARGARVVVLDVDAEGRLLSEAADRALTSRTRLVAISHVSNVLGYVNPVAEICALARQRGVPVLIDGAQSAPHVKIDVRALGCDFLAFSSHKMLGPMGVGVLYARADRLKEMAPYHVGSNMAHGMDLASAAFEPGALRFQAGTPNVSGPVALAAALDVIEGWGFDQLTAHDTLLAAHALNRFAQVPGLRLIGPRSAANRVPVFTFNIGGITVPALVAAADAAGIAIRGGDMAAVPLLQKFGVTAAARVSAYVYNTTADLDRLADVLMAVTSRGA